MIWLCNNILFIVGMITGVFGIIATRQCQCIIGVRTANAIDGTREVEDCYEGGNALGFMEDYVG